MSPVSNPRKVARPPGNCCATSKGASRLRFIMASSVSTGFENQSRSKASSFIMGAQCKAISLRYLTVDQSGLPSTLSSIARADRHEARKMLLSHGHLDDIAQARALASFIDEFQELVRGIQSLDV